MEGSHEDVGEDEARRSAHPVHGADVCATEEGVGAGRACGFWVYVLCVCVSVCVCV